jgi:hypothetical protein
MPGDAIFATVCDDLANGEAVKGMATPTRNPEGEWTQ